MRVTGAARALAYALRWVGVRWPVRGWRKLSGTLFPVAHQSGIVEQVDLGHLRYAAHLDSYIDWVAFFFGAYERELLVAVETVSGPLRGRTVLDVGANVGHHALWFAGRGAQVHAFEPDPALCRRIKARIAENPGVDIVVHAIGLGQEESMQTFYPAGAVNEGQGSFKIDQGAAGGPTQKLRISVGDNVVARRGIASVALVKIDVEGLEPDVIAGLRRTLERERPLVVCEIGNLNRDEFPTLAAFVAALPPGYEVRYLRSSGRLVRRYRPCTMDDATFTTFSGNVIAVPLQ